MDIAEELTPFLPDTSKTIKELIKQNKMPEKPLFPRIDLSLLEKSEEDNIIL